VTDGLGGQVLGPVAGVEHQGLALVGLVAEGPDRGQEPGSGAEVVREVVDGGDVPGFDEGEVAGFSSGHEDDGLRVELALTEQFLAGSGSVSICYFLTPSEKQPYLEVLVIRYSGEYPFGSGGNADAIYMHAMAKAAVAAFEPWGVIHDFSELRYV
jgi:hypothetical protein